MKIDDLEDINNNSVLAIRIYLKNYHIPIADVVLSNHKCITMEWDDINNRKLLEPHITAYTLFYDERPKRHFKEWIV